VVSDGEVMWRIADAAWLYVLDDRARAGNSLVTMAVSDLEKAVHEIRDRGIVSAPVEVIVGAGRKASFTDPEGNLISFIEVDAH
jgi:predicted enzyme related to lactoylglutathione lyase